MKIGVILSTVRPGRNGERVSLFLQSQISNLGHTCVLIDPLQHKLPLFQGLYAYMEPTAEPYKTVSDLLKACDCFVVVSAEYNHSIPPPLSNLMDSFRQEYFQKPTGICCYSAGPFGGVRAAMQLRPFLAELGTITIPKILPFPVVQNALNDAGVPVTDQERLDKNTKDFLGELIWFSEALGAKRLK